MRVVEGIEKVSVEMLLHGFLIHVKDDACIGPSHISVYVALVDVFQLTRAYPVSFHGRELMRMAKISSRTYHQCIGDLHKSARIKYIPSFNPALGSVVWFVEL